MHLDTHSRYLSFDFAQHLSGRSRMPIDDHFKLRSWGHIAWLPRLDSNQG